MSTDRLAQQIAFIVECDRLKTILRQNWIIDGSRAENDAEHSWHIAVMALLLAEHADAKVDVARVVGMLLVHDIVEIDAGDTFIYDAAGHADKDEREQRAADRLFGLLPPDQAEHFRGLWDEFEARQTPEARFAAAIDRLQPVLLNCMTEGKAWRRHGVTADKVVALNSGRIGDVSQSLWDYARGMIEEAVAKGHLAAG